MGNSMTSWISNVSGDKAIADYRQALLLAPSLAAVIRYNLQRLGAEP